ncbi:pyrimidine/purine nucleoside phosphorylase [Heliophilum fasciatum]|uniref:Uncharacterized protein n=1 Tax=Heliophilum fasciatum TaxID=35700 RepID=A0A4R2R6N9_9FIRM|nr:pyrimidine/purine nucleoside phosphorylase [Heliophilum fasciatum]MCW2279499.1 uncharacterized protein YaiE (UPF0345 family) [Heliophilum fasciatum]TCP58730.1 hypothetical protein EDD73_1545 [Heliophilum fasciatum]
MKHNVYFDGKVQSLEVNTENGPATIGVITPGQYTFGTSTQEKMVITSGTLKVKLPEQEWRKVASGEFFTVPQGVSFVVEAEQDVSYLCYYF